MTELFIILFAFIAWIMIDFNLGRKRHLQSIAKRNYPTRNGNWKLFDDGKELYTNLFQDISNAKEHIHILFYIIRNDKVSREFLKLLRKKARDGVIVRLLLDRIGGWKIPKKEISKLKKSGVLFSFSNRPMFPFLFYTLNYRNHRKITVVDGRIGYFGGFNIGKEYIGQDPHLGYWRDFHLKLEGDGVQDLQAEFILDWKDATKEHLMNDRYFPELQKGSLPMCFVPTDGAYVKEFLVDLIQKATSEILIGTPYFIPGNEILGEILQAIHRGVAVSILVPLKADHAFVREAAFPYFKPLLEAGCSIYRYNNGFYHGKIILIDNKLCDFGTANFDKRSFFINDEINCLITDPLFIEKIRSEYMNDINHHSVKLTLFSYRKRPLLQRGKELFSTLLSDFL